MRFEEIWGDFSIIFDSSSILRLYDWEINKSLLLKDIFDCMLDRIYITQQIEKEIKEVYKNRITYKKKKFTEAVEEINCTDNIEKIIKSFKKRCEGYSFPQDFIREINNNKENAQKLYELGENFEKDFNEYLERIDIDYILNRFFWQKFNSNLDYQKIKNKYKDDSKSAGHKDKAKKKNAEGDRIIWEEIIQFGRKYNKNIVFVSADVKPDWFEFNKQLNKRIVRKDLIESFEEQVGKEYKLEVITITDFLEVVQKYIDQDIKYLIKHSKIIDEIEEKYSNWYPEDLVDLVERYVEEDGELQLQVQESVDCCVDYIKFDELEEIQIVASSYEIDDDRVYISVEAEFTLTLDALAYGDNEIWNLGNPSTVFKGIITASADLWESEETDNKAISKFDNVSIHDLILIQVSPIYEEEEQDDYDYEEQYDYDYEE